MFTRLLLFFAIVGCFWLLFVIFCYFCYRLLLFVVKLEGLPTRVAGSVFLPHLLRHLSALHYTPRHHNCSCLVCLLSYIEIGGLRRFLEIQPCSSPFFTHISIIDMANGIGHVTINVEGNILCSQNLPTAKRD